MKNKNTTEIRSKFPYGLKDDEFLHSIFKQHPSVFPRSKEEVHQKIYATTSQMMKDVLMSALPELEMHYDLHKVKAKCFQLLAIDVIYELKVSLKM